MNRMKIVTGLVLTISVASSFAAFAEPGIAWEKTTQTAVAGIDANAGSLVTKVATERSSRALCGDNPQASIDPRVLRGVPMTNGAFFRPENGHFSAYMDANALDSTGAPLSHPVAWLDQEIMIDGGYINEKFNFPMLTIDWNTKGVELGDKMIGWLVPNRAVPGTYIVDFYGYKLAYDFTPQSDVGDGPEQYGNLSLKKTGNQLPSGDPAITCTNGDEQVRLVIADGQVAFAAFDNLDHSYVGDLDRARYVGQLDYQVISDSYFGTRDVLRVIHVDAGLLDGGKTGRVIEETPGTSEGANLEYTCR